MSLDFLSEDLQYFLKMKLGEIKKVQVRGGDNNKFEIVIHLKRDDERIWAEVEKTDTGYVFGEMKYI